MRQKLKTDRGETLVEVLASILIASLSVALLFGCIMASSNMDRKAGELDRKHYEALTAAEAQDASEAPDGKVEVKNSKNSTEEKLDIKIYGASGLYSYKRSGS